MQPSKRRLLLLAPALLVSGAMLEVAQAGPRVIRIEARKFRYAPNVITLKKDEEVVLELTALDFSHGFTVPDFHLRADLVAGQAVTVNFRPDRAGKFAFLCDNFCGSGHEEMGGMLIVNA